MLAASIAAPSACTISTPSPARRYSSTRAAELGADTSPARQKPGEQLMSTLNGVNTAASVQADMGVNVDRRQPSLTASPTPASASDQRQSRKSTASLKHISDD